MDAKKSILFVLPSLDAGGGEKSLVNLLSVIDLERYDVDLLLFHKTGIFLKLLPPQVNVLEVGGNYRIFSKGVAGSVLGFASKFKFGLVIDRLLFALKYRRIKNRAVAEQQSWKNVSASIAPLEKKYDAAIGFLEKSSVYFVADKVRAKKKIGWIHTNYDNSGMDPKFDAPYFEKLDHMVTVSDVCLDALRRNFPQTVDKLSIIPNLVSEKAVKMAAESGTPEIIEGIPAIISVGRLSAEKGFSQAVKAAGILKSQGIAFCWYIIGDGPERENIRREIASSGLETQVRLLGTKGNPQAYVAKADIYVQPSLYEGKSMAIDEAKILRKPIVVTNFATVKDQISDSVNGIVAEMNPECIAEKINILLSDKALCEKLSANLAAEIVGNEAEITKLYALIS